MRNYCEKLEDKLHLLDYDTGDSYPIETKSKDGEFRHFYDGKWYDFDALLEAMEITSYRAEFRGGKQYSSDIDMMDRDVSDE